MVDENNVLLGVLRGTCPNVQQQWGNFTIEFTNQYRINRHLSVDYYREFIEDVTDLISKPREILSFQVPLELQYDIPPENDLAMRNRYLNEN